MGDLYFKVRADWEQAVMLKRALDALKKTMEEIDTTSEDGAKQMAELTKQYEDNYKALRQIVDAAAKNAKAFKANNGEIPDMILKYSGLEKASFSLGKSLVKMGLNASTARAALAAIGTGGVGLAISAVTLLVRKAIKVWQEKKQAIEEAREEQRKFYEEVGKNAAPAIQSYEELKKTWLELKDEMSKRDFLIEHKKDLEKLGIATSDVNTAEEIFINRTKEYWDAQLTRARADVYREKVQEKLRQKIQLEEQAKETRTVKKATGTGKMVGNTFVMNEVEVQEYTDQAKKAQKEIVTVDKELETLQGQFEEAGNAAKVAAAKLNPENDYNGPFLPENYQNSINKAKREWDDAKARLDVINNNRKKYTKDQYLAAKKDEADARKEYENLVGKENNNINKSADEKEKAYKQYGERIQQAVERMWGDVSAAQVNAIEDASKRELAAIDKEYRDDLERIAQMRAEVEALGLPSDEWVEMDNKLTDLTNAANARHAIRLSKYQEDQDARDHAEAEAFEELLAQYGTYEERKAQIHIKWLGKIGLADEEHAKIYRKLYEQELDGLEKEYSAEYTLVFQNAAALTDNQLTKALEIVHAKIAEAKDDAASLNALYERLQGLQSEDRRRNAKWGFGGISDALSLLGTAQGDINSGDKNKVVQGINERSEALQGIRNGAEDILGLAQSIASIIPEMNGDLADGAKILQGIGGFLSGIGASTNFLLKSIESLKIETDDKGGITGVTASAASGYSAMISAAATMLSGLLASIHANKVAEEEWNRTIEKTANAYKMIQIEKLSYEPENIFGVEDPFKKATDSANVFNKSMEEIQKTTDKLNGGKVQTGTKKVVDWSKVGQYAAIGAGAGAVAGAGVFSGITAGIGAALGAAVGVIVGLFSTKVEPVYESLASHYEYLFDPETYELNPQILADYEKLDEDTKLIVDHWDELQQKMKEAREELKANLAEFSGDVGKQLEESLVSAWKNRRLYSAIDDFKKYVSSSIAQIMQEKVFSAIFGDIFNELERRMEDSFLGENGDMNIIDDLDWLNNTYQQRLKYYDQAMSAAQAQMERMGYDGFDTEDTKTEASRGNYQNISETTGSAIEGRLTSLQVGSELRNQQLALTNTTLSEMLKRQLESVTLADDIRTVQAQSYIALKNIESNTDGNLKAVKDIQEKITNIEKHTRNL